MTRSKNLRLYSLVFLCLIQLAAQAQCPTAAFTIASPVCAGSSLNITNNSTNAVSYRWDFSPGYYYSSGTIESDTTLALSFPGDINAYNQNDTVVVFLTGKADGNVYRITYANGPENPVTNIENFANLSGTLFQPGDITLYNENGNWYGIVVDYGNNSVVRFELGNSILNPPANPTTLLNNTNSNISTAWSIKLAKDEVGDIYGLVANFTAGSFTLLNFGNSILNTPVPSAPISTGQGTTLDLELVHSCGHWIAFLAGYTAATVVMADFGNSFGNTPTLSTIITNGSPADIEVVEDSSSYKMLYTNYSSHTVYKYDLGSNLAVPNPVYIGSESFGGTNPKGISVVRSGRKSYVYLLNTGTNQVKCISYGNASSANTGVSTDFTPTGISFANEGSYPVTLTAYDSNGSPSSVTQLVTVSASPATSFTSTGSCLGDQTIFTDLSTISSGSIGTWQWTFGNGNNSSLQNPSETYSDTGQYIVSLTATSANGCSSTFSDTIPVYVKPTASFSTPSATCSRSLLSFTDLSTIVSGSIDEWRWNFGNGDTSVVQNPDYIYPAGGNYTVTLTATSNTGCSDDFTATVNINDRPTALFNAINTCVGQQVQFNDESTINGSTIISYDWDLGDGTTSSISNPAHQYANTVADYPVSLIIVAQNGCTDTISDTIRINNIPTAAFTTTGVLCSSSEVQFVDQSTVAGDTINSYFWDFGDGNTASSANPSHLFSVAGNYTVTLIAYAPTNCPSVPVQQTINVLQAPTPDFDANIACTGSASVFTNQSLVPAGESIDSTLWRFTQNDSSTSFNSFFIFPAAGFYDVDLHVVSSSGCSADTTIQIKVSSLPVPSFSTSNNCSSQQVQFNNLSTNDSLAVITAYSWDFGDPGSGVLNTSMLEDPIHVFNTAQSYQVTLTVTNNHGCTASTIVPVLINQSPLARFTYSPTCYGELMQFFNPGSPADSAYLWNFGDFQVNQLRDPSHFYAFVGNYTVTLTVYAANGCVSTATRVVTVSPLPNANFSNTNACLNTPVQFTDLSTISAGSITRRHWYVNNTLFDSTTAVPSYTFDSLGTYQVRLEVFSDIGCSRTVTRTITVNPLPVANFSFTPQFGNPPLDVSFINLSSGASTYEWNFGDSSSPSTLFEPQHQYIDTGIFNIRQIAISAVGCRDTAIKNIYVIKPVLDIAVTGDSSYYDGTFFHVVTYLTNLGTREINSLKVIARLDNGNQIKEDFTGIIPSGPGGQITYAFRAAFPILNGERLRYYCVQATDPNQEADNVPSNNERCFSRTDEEPGIEVFPNPFTDRMTVRLVLPFSETLSVSIIDQLGRQVAVLFDGQAEEGLLQIEPDVAGLGEGIYTLRVIYNDGTYYRQMIKVRIQK